MISKRGELTTKEIMEIILAAAVVLVLAFLLYRLISPSFDYNEEAAKSYYDSFEEVMAEGGGSFLMWQPEKEGVEFYLAYFHNDPSFFLTRGKNPVIVRKFESFGNNVNHVCVCYWDGKSMKCNYCSDLDMPLVKDGKEGEAWVLMVGEEIKITKGEDCYNVSLV